MIAALIVLVSLLVLLTAAVLGALVVRDTVRKQGRWGINVQSVTARRATQCPNCSTPLPAVRVPKNLREMLWGGWTCSGCNTALDKWGRALQ